jgi:hypothetical protein
MGYYGGAIIAGKCEDFPACGHYERETGETFCPQPEDDPTSLEYALTKASEMWNKAQREKAKREEFESRPKNCQEAFEAAPSSYMEYHGGGFDGKCIEDDYQGFRMCKGCVAEVEAEEYYQAERDAYMGDHY